MAFAKKSHVVMMVPTKGVQRELEFLYSRRCAIDSLIESLEAYNRARTQTGELRKRKTA